MGSKMRTRPIARKGADAPSRKHKREMTKSVIRRKCQTQTRGAANRAAKELNGKPRGGGYNRRRAYDRWQKSNPSQHHGFDEPLADWELEVLNDRTIADADADRFFGEAIADRRGSN